MVTTAGEDPIRYCPNCGGDLATDEDLSIGPDSRERTVVCETHGRLDIEVHPWDSEEFTTDE